MLFEEIIVGFIVTLSVLVGFLTSFRIQHVYSPWVFEMRVCEYGHSLNVRVGRKLFGMQLGH